MVLILNVQKYFTTNMFAVFTIMYFAIQIGGQQQNETISNYVISATPSNSDILRVMTGLFLNGCHENIILIIEFQ